MLKIENYIKIFKKYGFTEDQNISDFWFKNKKKISKEIFSISGEEDPLSLKLRWHSRLGIVCQREVRKYIEKKQNNQERIRGDLYGRIDFNDFSFQYEKEKYNLKSFALQFETSQMMSTNDLRGINLDEISFNLCKIINCFFATASFRKSNFQQCWLINTNLVKTDFSNSRFVSIKVDEGSQINGINLKGAFVNAIELNEKAIGNSVFSFTQVSYLTLIKDTIKKLCKPNDRINYKNRNETVFSGFQITGVNNSNLKRLHQYLDWYQYIYYRLSKFKNESFLKRILFLLSIIFTKHWSSLWVLTGFAISINFVYGILIYIIRDSFQSKYTLDIFDSFYLSIVTFSSLGFGDIVPINWIGQLLVLINVVSGYVVLGIFIFLLTNKINYKY